MTCIAQQCVFLWVEAESAYVSGDESKRARGSVRGQIKCSAF